MARRKHQVIVEITFEKPVTEKQAKEAVESLLVTTSDTGIAQALKATRDVYWGKTTFKSATRTIASLKAMAKGVKRATKRTESNPFARGTTPYG